MLHFDICSATRNGRPRLGTKPAATGSEAGTVRHEIFELAGLRVEAESVGVVVLDLADDHRAVFARVDRNLSRRPNRLKQKLLFFCPRTRIGFNISR
jgi:hypothetical protein